MDIAESMQTIAVTAVFMPTKGKRSSLAPGSNQLPAFSGSCQCAGDDRPGSQQTWRTEWTLLRLAPLQRNAAQFRHLFWLQTVAALWAFRHRGDAGETSSLRFIDKKLSVSRRSRLYSRPLPSRVRRTDQQHRFVWAAPDASKSRPAPSRKVHNSRDEQIKASVCLGYGTRRFRVPPGPEPEGP